MSSIFFSFFFLLGPVAFLVHLGCFLRFFYTHLCVSYLFPRSSLDELVAGEQTEEKGRGGGGRGRGGWGNGCILIVLCDWVCCVLFCNF